jgi:hypothetical protein
MRGMFNPMLFAGEVKKKKKKKKKCEIAVAASRPFRRAARWPRSRHHPSTHSLHPCPRECHSTHGRLPAAGVTR